MIKSRVLFLYSGIHAGREWPKDSSAAWREITSKPSVPEAIPLRLIPNPLKPVRPAATVGPRKTRDRLPNTSSNLYEHQ